MSEASEVIAALVDRLDERTDGNRDRRGAPGGRLAPVGLVHQRAVDLRRRSLPRLLNLVDLDSSEPIFMAGLKGKVVWIVFWSAEAPAASSRLAAIARASKWIRPHRRFSLVTAAVPAGNPDRVRGHRRKRSRSAGLPRERRDSLRGSLPRMPIRH